MGIPSLAGKGSWKGTCGTLELAALEVSGF